MLRTIRQTLLAATFSLIAAAAQAQTPSPDANRFTFDRDHTNIMFSINHMGFSDMIGRVTDFDGYFIFDPQNPSQGTVQVTMKPVSITTSSRALDSKLQGPDFFDTDNHQLITYKSTAVNVTSSNTADITGDLTMHGITRPVILKVRFNKADFHQYSGAYVAGFSANTVIRRSDFGMNAYLPVVGDEVRIVIEVEGINAERSRPGINQR